MKMAARTQAKRDYAGMGEISFSFVFGSSELPGVEEGSIRFQGPKIWGGDHTGWAAPLIRVKGTCYLTKQITDAILGDGGYSSFPGIKYGPGGRRKYYTVTEAFVSKLLSASQSWRTNSREERIAYERGEFVLALVDLLGTDQEAK